MAALMIGLDVVDQAELSRAITRPNFVEHVFGPEAVGRSDTTLAEWWAIKEAVLKVLGTGLGHVRLVDIVIAESAPGQPEVILVGTAQAAANASGVRQLKVTVSRTRHFVTALVLGLP